MLLVYIFIVFIKTGDIYENVTEDFESRFGTSQNKLNKPLLKGKNEKGIGLIKDELGGKMMIKFVGLRAKPYSYLIDDISEGKKAKGTKKKCNKITFKFENYKSCLEGAQFEFKINYLEKI